MLVITCFNCKHDMSSWLYCFLLLLLFFFDQFRYLTVCSVQNTRGGLVTLQTSQPCVFECAEVARSYCLCGRCAAEVKVYACIQTKSPPAFRQKVRLQSDKKSACIQTKSPPAFRQKVRLHSDKKSAVIAYLYAALSLWLRGSLAFTCP